MHYMTICYNLQDTRSVNGSLVVITEPPSSAVQVNVPASSGVRLLVVTFCVTPLNVKHIVHPTVSHVNIVEDVTEGTVTHIRVTLLNIGQTNVLRDPLTGVPAGLLIIVALVKFCKPVPIKHQSSVVIVHLSNQIIVHMILLKKIFISL